MATTITANKNYRTVQASASNAAAGTTTSSSLDLTTRVGPHVLTAKVTNGGTGPTIPCTLNVLVSGDNSAFKNYASYTALTGNSIVTEWAIPIEPGVMYLETSFTGNTGQAVTVEAFLQELTSYTNT